MRWIIHLPQGSSLEVGLCCPGPSTLNRPHPPRSRAHRDFTAQRLIRDAFAVRERLGDPRAVPGFRCTFRPGMPSSMTPGSSNIDKFQSSDVDIGLRRDLSGSALPKSRNPFRAGQVLRGFTGSLPLRPVRLLAPLHGSDRLPGQRGLLHPGFQRNRLVAGHDYSSDWTPLLAGLSPAGMAASLAAPDPLGNPLRENASPVCAFWKPNRIRRPVNRQPVDFVRVLAGR